jgi:hypothetical protein
LENFSMLRLKSFSLGYLVYGELVAEKHGILRQIELFLTVVLDKSDQKVENNPKITFHTLQFCAKF